MAIIAKRITLTNQPFTIPRMIAGIQINLTDIDRSLYVTRSQMEVILDLTARSLRDHIDNIYQEITTDARGGEIPPPLQLSIYEAEVQFQSRTSVGGGGGTQVQKFYPIRLISMIAERMQLTERRAQVMREVHDVYNEYQNTGVAVNDYVLRKDPKKVVQMQNRATAYNFSIERHQMADENVDLTRLLNFCNDVWNSDGSLNAAMANRNMSRMHNTAHVSVHGMTAKQLVYTRMNSADPYFGQYTFSGLNAPRDSELKLGCNFLSNMELYTRTHVIRAAIGRVGMHVDIHGRMSSSQMLKMFTMFCVSPHIPFNGWEWEAYPETAFHSILDMPAPGKMRKYITDAINIWKVNYPNRQSLNHEARVALSEAEAVLCAVCADGYDIYES